jgi:hypothetical protein
LKNGIRVTELKLVLDSGSALREGYELSDELKSCFDIKKPAQEMRIWYLDTAAQDLQGINWIVRYRYHEGCDFELTFKKRYSEAEYKSADGDEFDAFKEFKPQIDMSVSKKTYSFSCARLFKIEDSLYDLSLDDAKRLSMSGTPTVFVDWNGKGEGNRLLGESVLYGPVEAMEHKGKYSGVDATFEIWRLGGFLTELSFKVETERSGELLNKLLDDDKIKRLVIRDGALKTEALFKYYRKHKELLS